MENQTEGKQGGCLQLIILGLSIAVFCIALSVFI